jgi:hypothetical protein
MDDKTRKRSFDYVLADIRNELIIMKKSAEERCEKSHQPGSIYRLSTIDAVLKYLEVISSSQQPWIYFDPEATYDPKRITKKTIWLLKKHSIIEGVDSVKDIQILNAFSKAWGLVDLLVAQMKNRLTRKRCMQIIQSRGTCRWERAAETYLSDQSGKGKIRRCLTYLYSTKLLPNHDRRDVQGFFRRFQKHENIDWTKAPDCILETKHRLEQLSASMRQRRKREREQETPDDN